MLEREQKFTPEPYVPLHVHTFYSLLGKTPATSSPELIVQTAKQKGFNAVAITDSQNFHGLGRFFAACKKFDIKPIPGVELPVDIGFGKEPAQFTFLALDNEGLLTLFSWTSKVKRDHQVLTPEDLDKRKGGLVILIRGENSPIDELLSQDDIFYAIDAPSNVQLRTALEIEKRTNKTVLAHEVRMANFSQVDVLKFLLQVYSGQKHQIDPRRPLNHTLKSPLEIWANYQRIPAAIGRTQDIAQSVKVSPPEAPKVKAKIVPEGVSAQAFLEYLAWKAANQIGETEKIATRISTELAMIRQFGFANYLLICYEIGQFCHEKGIEFLVTGSGNNSLVLKLLGLTKVAAVDLMFERFLNPHRADFPDVDFDFPYDRRGEVVEFILNRYNEATLLSVVKRLRKDSLLKLAQQHDIDLSSAQLQQLEAANLPYEVATHPSGVTFSNWAPQQTIESNVLAQLDTADCEKIYHLPKIDLLSNIGLARFAKTKSLLAKDGVITEIVPENDPGTLARIFSGKTLGISGIESPHLANILKTIGTIAPNPNFEHLVQALALARPAAAARQIYYGTLAGKEHPFSQYPEIAKIIEPTGFTIIFQEQVMQIATEVADLPFEIADDLRKMMGEGVSKSEREKLISLVDSQFAKKNYPEDVRRELVRQFTNFASYGFLEGHARALATLSYELAFLAEHYPSHFWAAVLSTVADKPEGVLYPPQAYINQALRDGIKFTFPTIDKLPQNPIVENGQVVIGKKLFSEKVNLADVYSQFLRLLYSGRTTPKILANYQMESFGSVFTANPIVLFPESVHFKPEKDRQIIVGQKLLTRKWRDLIFVTLDSGTLLNVILPLPLAQRKQEYLQNPFWRLNIRKLGRNWEVFDILPPISVP